MKAITTITTALLLGTTAFAVAQTPAQSQGRILSAPQPALNADARRPALQRETTGMGSREPEAQFLFDPIAKEPQRNDPTVTPFGPMNNIE